MNVSFGLSVVAAARILRETGRRIFGETFAILKTFSLIGAPAEVPTKWRRFVASDATEESTERTLAALERNITLFPGDAEIFETVSPSEFPTRDAHRRLTVHTGSIFGDLRSETLFEIFTEVLENTTTIGTGWFLGFVFINVSSLEVD